MGGNGVSDISTRAGEGVGGVVNGAGLTSGSIASRGVFTGVDEWDRTPSRMQNK